MYDASHLPKVIYGVNWATRTFNRNAPDSQQDEIIKKAQETVQAPKPKESKKKAVVIEVMPGESMSEGFADYRPLLQRDGLILWGWEIDGEEIRIVWLRSNGGMHKYQALIDDESELATILPEKRYDDRRYRYRDEPDFIIYATPIGFTVNMRKAFIAKLKASGVSVNFDYEYSLGRQRQDEEKAVADKIQNFNFITADEAELLEVYRQFSNEEKTELIKRMEAMLNEQEMEIKNA